MKIKHAYAVISGGASGLGLATAKRIVRLGGRVTLLDINPDTLNQALDELGENTHGIVVDICNEKNLDAAISDAHAHMGNINLAVNCAGIAPSQRVLGRDALMSTAEFERVIRINLIGSFTLCRAVVQHMQHNSPMSDDNERGVIINTASIAAMEGQIGQAAYAAAKGGIVSMALPLAREFARIGVRVMTIAPGLFETPMFDSLPVAARDALAANTPYPARLGHADEYAALVQHIFENSMLNGEVIRLDGALRMSPK